MNKAKARLFTIALAGACSLGGSWAQTPQQEIRQTVGRAAGTFFAYPAPEQPTMTPPPIGKKPFYVNHYGCQGSYNYDRQAFYDTPYQSLAKADTLGKLTPLGRDAMQRIDRLRHTVENQTGELTLRGVKQQQAIADRLKERFPELFTDGLNASARSTTVNRCILSMEQALIRLARQRPAVMTHKASLAGQYYLNPQDKTLQAMRMDSLTRGRYEDFAARHGNGQRLMNSLFNDPQYVKDHIDANELAQQIFDLAGCVQNTALSEDMTLYDLFTPDETYDFWKKMNAWWYINYGGCTLNGGLQPYTQRGPLRKMIEMGDSMLTVATPTIHLRYTMETVVMPLVCLLELDGFGLATDDLETLDTLGWADYRLAPMSGNIQMIHYRESPDDDDPLVKVLLNEREATLPVESDCKPYYHWRDVRAYYLKKLDAYEHER